MKRLSETSVKPETGSGEVIKVEDGAEALVELLKAHGLKYIFLTSGTDMAPILEALSKFTAEGRKCPVTICVPHEIPSAAMALGYAAVSHKPAALAVHVVAGTANALGNIMEAYAARLPVIIIAGRTPFTEEGVRGCRDLFVHWKQEFYDQGGFVRQCVKWDYELRTNENLSTVVSRAFSIANSQPPGPVYLMLPRELLVQKMSHIRIPRVERSAPALPPEASPDVLTRVAEMLIEAENPLVITSAMGRNPAGVDGLVRLAQTLAVPVIEYARTFMNFPTGNPMHLGFDVSPYVEKADVILVVDSIVPWTPASAKPSDSAKTVQIDVDPLHLDIPIWGFPFDLQITADPLTTIQALGSIASKILTERPSDSDRIRERGLRVKEEHDRQRAAWRAAAGAVQHDKPIDFIWLSHVLDKVKDEDTVIVNEYDLVLPQVEFNKPGTYFGATPASYLGRGLGEAIGVKIAAPDRTVVCCVGDGSYIFCVPYASHWVAKAYDLPFLTVIFNNQGWSAVKVSIPSLYPEGWSVKTGKFTGVHLDPPGEFIKVVEAFGGYGEKVEDPDDLRSALARGLKAVEEERRQAVIDVICKRA